MSIGGGLLGSRRASQTCNDKRKPPFNDQSLASHANVFSLGTIVRKGVVKMEGTTRQIAKDSGEVSAVDL
jgi:hypothetical protein